MSISQFFAQSRDVRVFKKFIRKDLDVVHACILLHTVVSFVEPHFCQFPSLAPLPFRATVAAGAQHSLGSISQHWVVSARRTVGVMVMDRENGSSSLHLLKSLGLGKFETTLLGS